MNFAVLIRKAMNAGFQWNPPVEMPTDDRSLPPMMNEQVRALWSLFEEVEASQEEYHGD